MSNTRKIPKKLWLISGLISLSSFLFGYCLSALNTVIVTGDNNSVSDCYDKTDNSCPEGSILKDIKLNTFEQQLATAMTILGAWIGCLIASKPSEKFGRKLVLLYNNIFFISGGILCSITNEASLMIGRLLVGLGVGIESVVVPILLSEIAPVAVRGEITTLHQLSLTIGILFTGVVGYGFVTYVNHGWKVVQIFTIIPPIIQLIFAKYLPESPRWLISNHNISEAKRVLKSLRPFEDHLYIDDEIQLISDGIKAELLGLEINDKEAQNQLNHLNSNDNLLQDDTIRSDNNNVNKIRGPSLEINTPIDSEMNKNLRINSSSQPIKKREITWKDVREYPNALIIGFALMSFSAITGVNSVIFYSSTIFGFAGIDEAILATIAVGLINVIMTWICTKFIDKYGRKYLLVRGTFTMVISLIFLGFSLLFLDSVKGLQGAIAVISLLIYICGFAIGLGGVAWVIMSEILPERIRSKAYGAFVSTNWAWNLLISLTTLTTIDSLGGVESDMDDDEQNDHRKIGVAYIYFLFAGITLFALIFIIKNIPETANKTVEELRRIGRGEKLFLTTKISNITDDIQNPLLDDEEEDDNLGKIDDIEENLIRRRIDSKST